MIEEFFEKFRKEMLLPDKHTKEKNDSSKLIGIVMTFL